MSKPRIAVASLGGTITMTSERTNGAAIRPDLDVDALLSAVPSLAGVANLVTRTLATKPGASLNFHDISESLKWARAAVAHGARGAVIVQGTDTIEETSYLLDLYWDQSEPLVVTGAMRPPQAESADGPANLLSSIIVAASPQSRDLGVLVIMNDEIHAASRVRKTNTSKLDAFTSPSFGALGYVVEGTPTFANRPSRWPSLVLPDSQPNSRVAMIETYLGDRGELLDLVTSAKFDGVVLAGFGVGHVSSPLMLSIHNALSAFPIVLASRTGSGTTFSKTYGFSGSEMDLLTCGVIGAGWLDARKARILLSSLVAANYSRQDIADEFARRGNNPGGPVSFASA